VSGFLSARPAAAAAVRENSERDRGKPRCMSKVGNETCYFLIPDHLPTFAAATVQGFSEGLSAGPGLRLSVYRK